MRLFAPVITLALLVIGGCSRADTPKAPEQAPTVDRAWVELTDRGAEARLITATAACPAASIDGKLTPMTQRAGPSGRSATPIAGASRFAAVRSSPVIDPAGTEGSSTLPPAASKLPVNA